MSNGLSQLLRDLATAPGFAGGMQQGQQLRREEEDRLLRRQALEQKMLLEQEMAPYALETARREAATAGMPKLTDKARQVQELVNEGIPRQIAVATAYGSERTYTDPTTGNIISYNPLESYFTDLGATTPQQQAQAAEVMEAEASGDIPPVDTIGMVEQPETSIPPGGRVLAQGTKEQERRAAEEEKQYKRSRELNQDVRDYSEALDKAGIPSTDAQLNEINKHIQGLIPDDIPGMGAGKKLFGEGGLIADFLNQVPIAGEALALLVPGVNKMLLTEEGKKMQILAQQLANQYMKEMAGSAVTGSEAERVLKALGQTNWSNPQEFLIGLEYIQRLNNAKKQNIQAGYGEEVVSEYESRQQRGRGEEPTKGFSPNQAEQVAENPDTGEVIYRYQGQWVDAQGKPYKPRDTATSKESQAAGQQQGNTTTNPQQQDEGTTADPVEPKATPVEAAIGILQDQMNKGASKQAVLNTLNEMKSNKDITIQQYRQIVRELELGTYNTGRRAR